VIPDVPTLRPMRFPEAAERTLSSGLRVVAVKRPGAPLAEGRLRIPLVATSRSGEALRDLFARALTAGTKAHSQEEIDVRVRALGATLNTYTNEDSLMITGSVPSDRASEFMGVVAEIVGTSVFPDVPVWVERARLAEEVVLARSQPEEVAGEALRRRVFGRHPYGFGLPAPSTVRRVTPVELRALHNGLTSHGVLTLVADLASERLIDMVSPFRTRRRAPFVVPPVEWRYKPLLVVHRPGAQQTNIRMTGPAPRRDAAFSLANLVFGGYFLSRLVTNLREEKGLTYSVRSRVRHLAACSTVSISADVRSEVTGLAYTEILSELERMSASQVQQDELDHARRYSLGVLSIQAQTKAGFADLLDSLLARGLDLSYLTGFQKAVATATTEDVMGAAARFLTPRTLTTVMVGDADRIVPMVEPFGPVHVR
jgi:zinc protease